MTIETSSSAPEAAPEPEAARKLDPRMRRELVESLRREQRLAPAIGAAAVAALLGAAAWAGVTVLSGWQVGYMAIGVGFIVGYAVRRFGRGIDPIYGAIGAGFALVGCLAGNLLTACGFVAQSPDVELDLFGVLAALDLDATIGLLQETFSPIDLLFYFIAVSQGFKLSRLPVDAATLEQALVKP